MAAAAWAPVGSNRPNQDPASGQPTLANVGGVPYVAWYGPGPSNSDIFVSRLDSTGHWDGAGEAGSVESSPAGLGFGPTLADVGGIPFLAFLEWDGQNDELRVSRLGPGDDEWHQPVGGASPLNHASNRNASTPSLAAIDGMPYVAWAETNSDFSGENLWVSRLKSRGTAWERVGGPSPVNGPGFGLNGIDLAVIDGVPHVAWAEQRGLESHARVARLKADGTGWEELAGGAQPIMHDPTDLAFEPSLTSVDGVPYVAFTEAAAGGQNTDVRVARLNAAGTAWEQVGGVLDHVATDRANDPDLTTIDGLPFVAWKESPGDADAEVHISQLAPAGSGWQEVAGGPSPIQHAPGGQSVTPSLTAVGGVPYVATGNESPTTGDISVSRLEPEFLDRATFATDSQALVLAKVRSYGVRYPIAFEYGPAPVLTQQTGTSHTAHGPDVDTVFRVIPELAPDTDYLWRAIGFDGFRATGAGPMESFTTRPAVVPDHTTRLLIAVIDSRLEALAGRSVRLHYLVTRRARVKLSVRRGGRVVATAHALAHAGRNAITWNGRVAGGRPRPGRYTLVLQATRADGQTASDRVRLRITRRSVR